MPYARPTLTALSRQILADIAAGTGEFATLRSSPLGIQGVALAGAVDGVHGYIDWVAQQSNPATATDEHLVAWAALVGVTRKEAASATASAAFTGVPGAILPNGTQVARTADGVRYLTTALGTVSVAGTVTVPLAAVEPGAEGNALSGAGVTIVAAISGVNSAGNLTLAASGGADAELEEDFRQRMLDRYAAPPQGGAPADYVGWALSVPGVTRAWARPNGAGAGTVVVYIMLDDARSLQGGFPQGTDGVAAAEGRAFPAAGDQLLVADKLFPLRPATALVYVVAPLPLPVSITVADLSVDTVAIRAAIVVAISAMFRRRGTPGGVVYQSDIVEAISSVPGVEHFSLVAPSGSIDLPTGYLPTVGTITWPS